VLFGDSVALSAHAHHAAGDDAAHGRALFLTCRENAIRVFGGPPPGLDYPAAGQLLFALGAWTLLRRPVSDESVPAEVALRLLALADRFAYNRMTPTMMWERITPPAEEAGPGRLDEFVAGYRLRQPPDLLAEAGRLAERLPG
jgi:hypothetical protein